MKKLLELLLCILHPLAVVLIWIYLLFWRGTSASSRGSRGASP